MTLKHLIFCQFVLPASAAAMKAFQEQLPPNMFPGYAPFNYISHNRKRDSVSSVGCKFQESKSNYCALGDICCWNFSVDNYGGFCCGDSGRCCGSGCCNAGYYCAYADTTTSVCCVSGSSCGEPRTTITAYQTTVVTAEYTTQATNTQLVTAAPSVVVQTQVVTKTNDAGQTFAQTIVVTSVAAAAAAASSTVAATSSSSSSSHTGTIVGGVVGGVAFLALLAAFLFIGTRKGWFERRPSNYLGYPQPDYPAMVSPNTNRSQVVSHGGTVPSVSTYQTHHISQQYAGEMEG